MDNIEKRIDLLDDWSRTKWVTAWSKNGRLQRRNYIPFDETFSNDGWLAKPTYNLTTEHFVTANGQLASLATWNDLNLFIFHPIDLFCRFNFCKNSIYYFWFFQNWLGHQLVRYMTCSRFILSRIIPKGFEIHVVLSLYVHAAGWPSARDYESHGHAFADYTLCNQWQKFEFWFFQNTFETKWRPLFAC